MTLKTSFKLTSQTRKAFFLDQTNRLTHLSSPPTLYSSISLENGERSGSSQRWVQLFMCKAECMFLHQCARTQVTVFFSRWYYLCKSVKSFCYNAAVIILCFFFFLMTRFVLLMVKSVAILNVTCATDH